MFIIRTDITDSDTASDPCYRCGYDLRATPDDRRCPECGLWAGYSRKLRRPLHRARRGWVRSLAWGLGLILISLVLTVITLPGEILLCPRGLAMRLPAWTGIVAATMFLLGVWLLTSSEEPATHGIDRAWRFGLRIAAAAPLILAAMIAILMEQVIRYLYGAGSPPDPSPWLFLAIFLMASLGCAPLPFLLFRELGAIAGRIRNNRLAKSCRFVGPAISMLILVTAALVMSAIVFRPAVSNDASQALMLLLISAAIAFGIKGLFLLVQFELLFTAAVLERRNA